MATEPSPVPRTPRGHTGPRPYQNYQRNPNWQENFTFARGKWPIKHWLMNTGPYDDGGLDWDKPMEWQRVPRSFHRDPCYGFRQRYKTIPLAAIGSRGGLDWHAEPHETKPDTFDVFVRYVPEHEWLARFDDTRE